MKKLESNVWKLYVIQSLRSFMLIMPVIVLFFQENGLSVQDVFVLQALFSVTTLALEIPTGYFADVFSRKTSLIIGGYLSVVGYAVYSISYGFWGFLVAETLLGISVGFVSGADSAMMYDTLLTLKRDEEYLRLSGRNTSISLFSEATASIMGGLMATYMGFRFPLCADVVVTACIVPLAISLVEPAIHNKMNREHSVAKIFEITRYALYGHAEIKWLIMCSSLVSASTLTMVWFIQPYLVETNVSVNAFGFVWAGLMTVAAFFSWHACQIERVLGRKHSLVVLIMLPVIGYALASTFWYQWSFLLLSCFYITRGIHNPVLSAYINGLIDSDIRATILSVKNIFGRLIFVVVGPVVGWVSSAYSLQIALMASGYFFFFFGVLGLLIMWHKKMI